MTSVKVFAATILALVAISQAAPLVVSDPEIDTEVSSELQTGVGRQHCWTETEYRWTGCSKGGCGDRIGSGWYEVGRRYCGWWYDEYCRKDERKCKTIPDPTPSPTNPPTISPAVIAAEAEAKRQAEEAAAAAKRAADEEARKKAEEEAARAAAAKAAAEAAEKREAEEAARQEAAQRAAEEAAQRAAEQEAARKAEEESARQRIKEEEDSTPQKGQCWKDYKACSMKVAVSGVSTRECHDIYKKCLDGEEKEDEKQAIAEVTPAKEEEMAGEGGDCWELYKTCQMEIARAEGVNTRHCMEDKRVCDAANKAKGNGL